MTAGPRPATYRDLLAVLCRDAEADYFLYRLSDPTYLMIEALLDALAQDGPAAAGRALDLCGGSGHLTRVLLRAPSRRGVVLADLHFWKLWLAARITAPGCAPVCCDANSPLPFADDLFSTVLLSDAFPYIWHKRMLAGEMARAATPDGVVVLPHLHSSQGENFNAGDTLTPAAYRDLFARLEPGCSRTGRSSRRCSRRARSTWRARAPRTTSAPPPRSRSSPPGAPLRSAATTCPTVSTWTAY